MRKDEEYKAEREAREQAETEATQAAEAQAAQLQSDMEQLKEELAASREELNALKEEKAVAEAQDRFNVRMGSVDQEFALTDEDRQVIANELKSLDQTEESFASYQEKLRVMWSHKAKRFLRKPRKRFKKELKRKLLVV